VEEKRDYPRARIDIPLAFQVKGQSRERQGTAKDIGVGGMLIETATPAAFGSSISIWITLPGADRRLLLPAVVRWVRAELCMGVQFGLLGALETHLITEISRASRPGGS
jgi:hypothetical protein